MKRIYLFLTMLALTLSSYAKSIYSCFLSQDVNMNTFEVSNQITNNSLITITLDGSTLRLGEQKTYSLFNRTVSNSGFNTTVRYDAIDGQNQRCKIMFITDSSADWTTRNAIVIWYNEISQTAKWYQSRDPETR
jgi:hypothetical protein